LTEYEFPALACRLNVPDSLIVVAVRLMVTEADAANVGVSKV
jgi:hypothetical protein